MDIETFHTLGVNGIHQELFAVAIMAVIARTLMALSMELASEEEAASSAPASSTESRRTVPEPQFKHAIFCLVWQR